MLSSLVSVEEVTPSGASRFCSGLLEIRSRIEVCLFSCRRTFHPFIEDKSVRLIGVEAAGEGSSFPSFVLVPSLLVVPFPRRGRCANLWTVHHRYRHPQPLGDPLLRHQGSPPRCANLHSPIRNGPNHRHALDLCRPRLPRRRSRALVAQGHGSRRVRLGDGRASAQGIIPALETAHAVWATIELAKTMPKDANIVMVRLSSFSFVLFLSFLFGGGWC
jgi:tryptophan synthase